MASEKAEHYAGVLQCVVVCCGVLHSVDLCCSVLQRSTGLSLRKVHII